MYKISTILPQWFRCTAIIEDFLVDYFGCLSCWAAFNKLWPSRLHIYSHEKVKINNAWHKLKLQAVVLGDFLFSVCAPFQGQSLLEANWCPLHPSAAGGKQHANTVCQCLAVIGLLSESRRCVIYDVASALVKVVVIRGRSDVLVRRIKHLSMTNTWLLTASTNPAAGLIMKHFITRNLTTTEQWQYVCECPQSGR